MQIVGSSGDEQNISQFIKNLSANSKLKDVSLKTLISVKIIQRLLFYDWGKYFKNINMALGWKKILTV